MLLLTIHMRFYRKRFLPLISGRRKLFSREMTPLGWRGFKQPITNCSEPQPYIFRLEKHWDTWLLLWAGKIVSRPMRCITLLCMRRKFSFMGYWTHMPTAKAKVALTVSEKTAKWAHFRKFHVNICNQIEKRNKIKNKWGQNSTRK